MTVQFRTEQTHFPFGLHHFLTLYHSWRSILRLVMIYWHFEKLCSDRGCDDIFSIIKLSWLSMLKLLDWLKLVNLQIRKIILRFVVLCLLLSSAETLVWDYIVSTGFKQCRVLLQVCKLYLIKINIYYSLIVYWAENRCAGLMSCFLLLNYCHKHQCINVYL